MAEFYAAGSRVTQTDLVAGDGRAVALDDGGEGTQLRSVHQCSVDRINDFDLININKILN
jgi:hypothetical protein